MSKNANGSEVNVTWDMVVKSDYASLPDNSIGKGSVIALNADTCAEICGIIPVYPLAEAIIGKKDYNAALAMAEEKRVTIIKVFTDNIALTAPEYVSSAKQGEAEGVTVKTTKSSERMQLYARPDDLTMLFEVLQGIEFYIGRQAKLSSSIAAHKGHSIMMSKSTTASPLVQGSAELLIGIIGASHPYLCTFWNKSFVFRDGKFYGIDMDAYHEKAVMVIEGLRKAKKLKESDFVFQSFESTVEAAGMKTKQTTVKAALRVTFNPLDYDKESKAERAKAELAEAKAEAEKAKKVAEAATAQAKAEVDSMKAQMAEMQAMIAKLMEGKQA